MDSRDYRDDSDIGMGGDLLEDMDYEDLDEESLAAFLGVWESASGSGYSLDPMGI